MVDLADEPVVPASAKLRLAALALSLGLAYETPGARLDPPHYEPVAFDGPKLAVIATGKRTGKTAVAGHWAALLRDQGADPVIVCMGRGGPAEPRVADAGPSLDELIAIAESGLARGLRLPRGRGDRRCPDGRVPAGGRRLRGCAVRVERAGRGGAGRLARPRARSSSRDRARAYRPWRWTAPCASSERARPSRSRSTASRAPTWCWRPRARPIHPPARSRSRSAPSRSSRCRTARAWRCSPPAAPPWRACPSRCSSSTNLARRSALAAELDRAAAERCDVYLTELKAAAIDTVAMRARAEGARVVFIRNRPIGIDDALVKLYRDAS